MTTVLTKGVPRCPNHNCPLVDLGFPLKPQGVGICPVSGAKFEYQVDLDEESQEMAVDKFGNKTKIKKYKITGDDN